MSRRRVPLTLLAFFGIMLAGVNLRPALTSVSPLVLLLGGHFDLSATGLGLLTTLPVLCLGLSAPLAPLLARRLGHGGALRLMLGVLIAALLIRPYAGVLGFYAGTATAGAAIGVLGVLLPAIVKRDFPGRASVITGAYTMALSFGGALGAGATEPLRLALSGSWQLALAVWTLPAVAALLIWLPQDRGPRPAAGRRHSVRRLLRDRLAWHVTLYMGLQSSFGYIAIGWLPTILADRGLSTVAAGFALSSMILISVGSALAAPWVSVLLRGERAMNALSMALFAVGLLGCLFAPLGSLWVWTILGGIGMGGAFAMALTLLAVRAPDVETAGQLSAMAQGFGYVLAAAGPVIVGAVHDAFGGWIAVGALLTGIGIVGVLSGLSAGRPAMVGRP